MDNKNQIDKVSFGACLSIILLASIPLFMFPDSGGTLLVRLYDQIANGLGFVYLLAGMCTLGFLMWLALGRYGKVLLGLEGDQPEFSNISWVAMLFCAGIGAGLMAWAPIEWGYYYDAPPFGVAARSAEAAEWASTYGIYHWGFTAWAFYCLPTIAIAYPYYVKRTASLRFSNSCYYWLGGRDDTRRGRVIDFLFMIGLLGGAGTSLGFSTPMISSLFARLTGLEHSFSLEFAVVIVSVIFFGISVWLGLRKGIKRLSELNLWLAFVLLAFVLLAGPTVFLLKTSVNSIGLMMSNLVRMSSWTDAFTDSGFVGELDGVLLGLVDCLRAIRRPVRDADLTGPDHSPSGVWNAGVRDPGLRAFLHDRRQLRPAPGTEWRGCGDRDPIGPRSSSRHNRCS